MRWLYRLGLGLVVFFLLCIPVMASYTTYIPLGLIENNTKSYPMLGVINPIDNAYLNQNGYLTNTSVTSGGTVLPQMLSAAKTNYAQPIAQNQSYANIYALNNSSPTGLPSIITGVGGYLTTANAADTQPGSIFSFEASGYVSSNLGYFLNKGGAITSSVGSGALSSSIFNSATEISQDTQTAYANPLGGADWYAQTFTPASGLTITAAEIYIRVGAVSFPWGVITLGLYNTSGGLPTSLIQSTSLPVNPYIGVAAQYAIYFPINSTALVGSTQYAIVISLPNGDTTTNYFNPWHNTGNPYSGGTECTSTNSGSTWSSVAANDLEFDINPPLSLTTPSSLGGNDVKLWSDGTVFEQDISNPSLVVNGGFETGGYNNLLTNPSFEQGNPPTGWTLDQGAYAQSNTQAKVGTYSMSLTRSGPDAIAGQNYANWATLVGKTVTAGIWIYTSTANTYLQIEDGTQYLNSANAPADSSWHFVTVSLTLNGSSSGLRVRPILGSYNGTAYFDGAELLVNAPPTSWTVLNGGGMVSQTAAVSKFGTYSAEVVDTTGTTGLKQSITSATIGSTYTIGAWMMTTTSSTGVLEVTDGVNTGSVTVPEDGAWHWLTASVTVAVAGPIGAIFNSTTGSEVYVDGLSVVLGSSITPTTSSSTTSSALNGGVPSNSNSWTFVSGTTFPYVTSFTETVGTVSPLRINYAPTGIVGDVSYSAGTVGGSAGNTAVTGVGTTWTDAMTDDILILGGDSTVYTVTQVLNNTSLLISPALTTSPSGDTYNLYSAVPNPADAGLSFGQITWGANPVDLAVSVSPLVVVSTTTPSAPATSIPAIVQGISGNQGPQSVPVTSNFPLYGIFDMAAQMVHLPTILVINIGAIFLLVAFGAMCLISHLGPLFTGLVMAAIYIILNLMHIADYWMLFIAFTFIILAWMLPKQTQVF